MESIGKTLAAIATGMAVALLALLATDYALAGYGLHPGMAVFFATALALVAMSLADADFPRARVLTLVLAGVGAVLVLMVVTSDPRIGIQGWGAGAMFYPYGRPASEPDEGFWDEGMTRKEKLELGFVIGACAIAVVGIAIWPLWATAVGTGAFLCALAVVGKPESVSDDGELKSLQDVRAAFAVERGRIRTPGKYEGAPEWVPLAYQWFMDGCADHSFGSQDEGNAADLFFIDAEERSRLGLASDAAGVLLHHSPQGFVDGESGTDSELASYIASRELEGVGEAADDDSCQECGTDRNVDPSSHTCEGCEIAAIGHQTELEPVAYWTWDADTYCTECTARAFGSERLFSEVEKPGSTHRTAPHGTHESDPYPSFRDQLTGYEGNGHGIYCSGCHSELIAPDPEVAREAGSGRPRNRVLELVRDDIRMNGEAEYSYWTWAIAVAACLFHCHAGMEVYEHLSDIQFRAGAAAGFPTPDAREEQELEQLNPSTRELLHASRVLSRARRRWPIDW